MTIRPRQTLGRVVATGMLGALLVLSAPGRVAVLEASAAPPTPAPGLIVPPLATGVLRINELLTCTDGTWSDATSYSYQWTRDGAPIGGATSATYTVVGADIACLLRCEVTATGPGGVSAPEPSAALASPWRPILLMGPDFVWAHSDQPVQSLGSPCVALIDPYGVQITNTATTPQSATYRVDHLEFDGLNNYYTLNSTTLALIQPAVLARRGSVLMTIQAPYSTSSALDRVWFAYGAATNAKLRALFGYTRFSVSNQFYDATLQVAFAAGVLEADNTWHAVVDTYDPSSTSGVRQSKHKLSAGARVDDTKNFVIPIPTTPATIATIGSGVNGGASGFRRSGKMRFIAHFDRVLTSTEIDTIRSVMAAAGYA